MSSISSRFLLVFFGRRALPFLVSAATACELLAVVEPGSGRELLVKGKAVLEMHTWNLEDGK